MFKRIIYPTDFSESSNRGLSFALSTACSHKSELIVFYTYRLISNTEEKKSLNGISIKKEKENVAIKKFQKIRKSLPEFLKVTHQFVSEVGFADERISSAIKRFDVDLLILSESIERTLKESFNLPKEKLADHFHCSVLLVSSLPVDQR